MNTLLKSKKGQKAFNIMREGAVAFGLAILFGAAIALSLQKVNSSIVGSLSNTSFQENFTKEILSNGTAGLSTLFSFSGTHMTILAIVILITLVGLIKFTNKDT